MNVRHSWGPLVNARACRDQLASRAPASDYAKGGGAGRGEKLNCEEQIQLIWYFSLGRSPLNHLDMEDGLCFCGWFEDEAYLSMTKPRLPPLYELYLP